MSRKPSLSEQLGKRRNPDQSQTEPVVPVNTLKEVEKALKEEPAHPDVSEQTGLSADVQASRQTRTDEHVNAEKRARTHARKQTNTRTSTPTLPGGLEMEELYEQIQNRKHLASTTFRYRPEEIDAIDTIHKELDHHKPGRISKNDIARLGLVWLCRDYESNGEASVLAQLLKRV